MIFSMIFLRIHQSSYYKVRVSTGGVEIRWLGWQFLNGLIIKKLPSCGRYVCRAVYLERLFNLVSAHFSALYVSFLGFFLRSDIPLFPFSPLFFEIGQGFVASPERHDPEYPGLKVIFPPNLRSDNDEVRSQKK